MSYTQVSSIFDGVKVPKKNLFEIFDIIVKAYPNISIIQSCADYYKIFAKEVDGEDLYEFLHDNNHIIEDDFSSYSYVGIEVFSVDDETDSCSQVLDTLPAFPSYSLAMEQLLELAFPKFEPHRFLIVWYI